jgi:hypothetical protein
MGVPQDERAPGANIINIFVTVNIIYSAALPSGYKQGI